MDLYQSMSAVQAYFSERAHSDLSEHHLGFEIGRGLGREEKSVLGSRSEAEYANKNIQRSPIKNACIQGYL